MDSSTGVDRKHCPQCGQTKSVDAFGKNKSKRDGLQSYCRPCAQRITKEWQERRRLNDPVAHRAKLDRNARTRREKYRTDEEYREGINRGRREQYASDSSLREKIADRNREWRERDPEAFREYIRQYRADNPDKMRAYHRRTRLKRFGLDEEAFGRLLAAQGGGCGICGTADPGDRDWDIDHDHETGITRGLLCHFCNKGLGLFGDDVERLNSAVLYMKDPPAHGFCTVPAGD